MEESRFARASAIQFSDSGYGYGDQAGASAA